MVATRPNFVKAAPLYKSLSALGAHVEIVHAGQHYDDLLSAVFVKELGLPKPSVNLAVGSGTHGQQTAATIVGTEQYLQTANPEVFVVVGDVNATLGGAIAAAKLDVTLVHLEAGLRCFDKTMPEELNRVVTDHLSDLCLAPSQDAFDNLMREGIPSENVVVSGNLTIDSLYEKLDEAVNRRVWRRFALTEWQYAVLTLHRPSNVDDPARLARLVSAVVLACDELPVVFPVHPRTASSLKTLLEARDSQMPTSSNIREQLLVKEPLGYVDFLSLLSRARVVFTDSGGVQEETSVLGIPCVTLRPNTERPITATLGTNRIAGTEPDAIVEIGKKAIASPVPTPKDIPLWDGKAAHRAAAAICAYVEDRRGRLSRSRL